MPESGLSKRLQQHSRRSGFAVGLSMVLAIAICFAAFTFIYVQLEPWVQDFAGAEEAPPTRTPRPVANDSGGGDEPSVAENDPEPTETPEPEPETPGEGEEPPIEERATEESEGFDPDYVMSAGEAVNFRSEPTSADGSTIINTVEPGTELQFLDERAEADIPDNGPWMRFRIEDGTEGWLREIDVAAT